MNALDITVIALYLLFIVWAAWCFRRYAQSSSQFINGGGSMPWWMAGATAFMTQFSAWTFTGAAGKAFTDGFPVLVLFWGNALGFFIACLFFAARYRKLRVETSMQVIALRFGKPTEQLFTWLQFPLSTLTAAIWLNGLAYILASMTGFGMVPTLLITGTVITFISASGGAWTVNATNVIQLVLILAITLVTGCFALYTGGGPGNIVERFPVDFWQGHDMNLWQILLFWIAMILMQQVLSTNNAITCYRFLVTRNEHEARGAAFLAGVLFVVGPVLWFIPPWVAATQGADLVGQYPQLGEQAGNAAYLYFVQQAMPAGTVGLTLAAMVAATIAPMSTALNRNAGIFIRNVYQRPAHGEAHLLAMGRWVTLLNGALATLTAWWMAEQEGIGFFELAMMVSSLFLLPLSIPALLAVVVRQTPDWAGWSTVLVGAAVSLIFYIGFNPVALPAWLGAYTLTEREASDLKFGVTVLAHVVFTGGFFIGTRVWYSPTRNTERRQQLTLFFRNMYRPLQPDEIACVDPSQARRLGALVTGMGLLLLPLLLLAEAPQGRWLHAAIVGTVLISGLALRHWAGSSRT
ncbi:MULTISPECIES: sodium:solute symporter family transporter [Pseudomonas]|uniref:Transporter n=2 Tax=Pseudomonas TaxID=286 RepID=A0ABS0FM28_PSELU|nr:MULTISPECIES: transporter [Pseudomonas]MBF8641410.1 transporter [Pseudomonas zeshuii]RRW50067.1 transporter [Pseudomonas luteola]SHJ00008.1 Na+/proline symporter [Pseudomonas zeshuii]